MFFITCISLKVLTLQYLMSKKNGQQYSRNSAAIAARFLKSAWQLQSIKH